MRFLDAYEKWAQIQETTAFKAEVDGIEDIDTHHLQLWKTPSPGGEWKQPDLTTYKTVSLCLRAAAMNQGITNLIIPTYPENTNPGKTNVDEATAKRLIIALARKAITIFKHWERSDKLASEGRDLTGVVRAGEGHRTLKVDGGVTEADIHATYRSLAKKNGTVRLGRVEFLSSFGYEAGEKGLNTPKWWPKYQEGQSAGKKVEFDDLQSGQYPTVNDLAVLFLLFLARTGWNQATAAFLNISDEAAWCKRYTEKYTWLYSFKHRSNEWQDTVSITQQRTGAYQIIQSLMNRTEPLREMIRADPSKSDNHVISARSPWISVRAKGDGVDETRVAVELSNSTLVRVLRDVIEEHNELQDSHEKHVPKTLAPGDFRDIFAAFTFKNTEYSMLLTQLALGHKSGVTTFRYLRQRAWTKESEKKKNALFVALIDQIQTHKKIDMTLLRAEMDGITVTQEMIDRLSTYRGYRTYTGMGCTDPKNPPRHIDPTNPRDGSSPCIQGHLCPGCPKGMAFNDSLQHLARRCAELDWLQDTLPLEVFAGSSLADQLLVLRATLKQWPTKEVEQLIANWTTQIANGSHQPIRFSGEH